MNQPCENMREAIAEYVLGLANDERSLKTQEHLAECSECQVYADELLSDRRMLIDFGNALDAGLEARQKKVIEALNAQPTKTLRLNSFWRKTMNSKITKMAVAALLVIAVLAGVEFIGGPGAGSIAFADVLEHFNSFGYTFDLTTEAKDESFNTVQSMVLEPGKMRMDAIVGLGGISTILDLAENKSMIIFHQYKTVQIQEMPSMFKDYGAESFLFLCTESIVNLWDMQDGTEEQLGEKEIDGHTATGFKVVQKGKYFNSEITIWADSQTADPVIVEIAMFPSDDSEESIGFLLNNFDLNAQLDEDLFSLEVPTGYTLAYQNSLDDLDITTKHSDQAEKIVQALELWSQGNNNKAIETLLAVDWAQPVEFSGEPHFFSMTEKELISLKPKDQQDVMKDVLAMSRTVKKVTQELLSHGQTAMSAQDYKQAEGYFQTALHLGKLLTRDPETILIVRLVGIAVEGITLAEITTLYTQTEQQEKLQAAQDEMQKMKAAQEEIKNKARGL